jgi:hypothetical protein
MSAVTTNLADDLRRLATKVAELPEPGECDCHKTDPQILWYEDAYERLCEKLADLKRGIATLDEVYEEAGL